MLKSFLYPKNNPKRLYLHHMNTATNNTTHPTKSRQLSKTMPNYDTLPEHAAKVRARKYDKNQDYHKLLKRTGITEEQLSQAFGYKSVISWRGARRRKLNQSIVVNLWRIFAEAITGKVMGKEAREISDKAQTNGQPTRSQHP